MLLGSVDFANAIDTSARHCKFDVLFASAFIKLPILEALFNKLPPGVSVTVVARWQKHDLVCRASDIEVYEFCKQRKIVFGISPSYHGKLYVFDGRVILLGSANLTGRGIGATRLSNIEFGTLIEPTRVDMRKLQDLLEREVTWVDDKLYKSMAACIDTIGREWNHEQDGAHWPSSIASKIDVPVRYLWMDELVSSKPQSILRPSFDDELITKDFELLGISIDNISLETIISAFKNTKEYMWLRSILQEKGECTFGKLSSELHSAVLDDPSPYRRTIKQYVAVLFDWAATMPEDFNLKRFSQTVSLSLKN